MSITVTLSNPGSPVTLSQTRILVELANVGPQGPQGIQGNVGLANNNTWTGVQTFEDSPVFTQNPWVDASSFGQIFSTAASPVDARPVIQAAIDSLNTLPGEVRIQMPSPPTNTLGIGYGRFIHTSGPVVTRTGQALVAMGGPPRDPENGVGVVFRAMDSWVGEAFIKDHGYDNDPVNDYAHTWRVENLGFDGRDLVPNAILVNQMGEESWIRGCQGRNFTEAVFKGTGIHASFTIEYSSGWDSPYCLMLTSHPDEADTLTGGNVRLIGLSGDDMDIAHIYLDGGQHIAALGTKSEQTPVGILVASVAGTGTGGAAAIIVLVGGTFNCTGGADLFKVTGAVARPIFVVKGVTHSSSYTNVMNDAVRSVVIPVSRYAYLLADWTYNGSSEFGSGGEVIFPDGFKMVRPSTGALATVMQYQATDKLHITAPLGNGVQIDDSTGAAIAKFRSQPAGGVEFSTWLRWDVDNTNDIGQDTLRPRNLNMGGYIQATEIADPAAPAANTGLLYFKDNGAGKTQLVARFPTGVVQVIATEP